MEAGSYAAKNSAGDNCGTVQVSRDGLFTVISFSSEKVDTVSRLYCLSGGRYVPVGIPAPDGGGLSLTRRFSRTQLAHMELFEADGFLIVPVGAPVPEADALTIPADVPPSALTAPAPGAAEIKQPLADEAIPASEEHPYPAPGWSSEPDPAGHFDSAELKSACTGLDGVLVSRRSDDVLLAFPYDERRSFPLVSAFRFGHPAAIGAGEYIIYRVRDGSPF